MTRYIRVDEKKFRRLWLSRMSVADISSELGIATFSVNAVRIRLGLKPRTAQTRAKAKPTSSDPTPEEILARAAEIRAKWDDETEFRRRVNKGVQAYEFPTISLRDITSDGMSDDG